MLNHRLPLGVIAVLSIGAWLFAGCRTTSPEEITGRIEHTGVIAGFAPGTETPSGSDLNFEPSALLMEGDSILIASDKPIPTGGPILRVATEHFKRDYIPDTLVQVVDEEVFNHTSKFESMASSRSWSFAASAFERISEEPREADSYNNLIGWPRGKTSLAKIINPTERGGVASSVSLRGSLRAALKSDAFPDGPPYYKIEGMACPDESAIVFGIREIGTDYANPQYCFILIQARIRREPGGGVSVDPKFRKVFEFQPTVPGRPELALGLSSVEYDAGSGRYYAVTSFENGEQIGAYLWTFTRRDLLSGAVPRLVRDSAGKPLELAHKAEGLTPLGGGRILVICDDDRLIKPVETGSGVRVRRPNEAVFYVIRAE